MDPVLGSSSLEHIANSIAENLKQKPSATDKKMQIFANAFFSAFSFVMAIAQKIIPTNLFSGAGRKALKDKMADISKEFGVKANLEGQNRLIQMYIEDLPKSKTPLYDLMKIKKNTAKLIFNAPAFNEIYNQVINKPMGINKTSHELSAQDLREIAKYLPDEEKHELNEYVEKLAILQEKSLDHLEKLVAAWQDAPGSKEDKDLHKEINALQKLDNSLRFRTGQFVFFRNDIQELRKRLGTMESNLKTLTSDLPARFQTADRVPSLSTTPFSPPLDATKELITRKIQSLSNFKDVSKHCVKIKENLQTILSFPDQNPLGAFVRIKNALLDDQSLKDTYELIPKAKGENLKDLSSIEQRAAYLPDEEKELLLEITSNLRKLRDNELENLGPLINEWQKFDAVLPDPQKLEAIKNSLEELRDEKPNEKEVVEKIKTYIPQLNDLILNASRTK